MPTDPVLDQQLVVHLYAPTDGPASEAAYRALRDMWLACRYLFGMNDPIPGTGLPHQLPERFADLPSPARTGAEAALAAQEGRGADHQAVLRRHHDLLNLSVALAPHRPAADRPLWRELDDQWSALTIGYARNLVGEARLYLARVAGDAPAPPGLGRLLEGLLPPGTSIGTRWDQGVALGDGLALWETSTENDDRALRRFVIATGEDGDAVASAWAWSRGDTAIPPLARYLLHAAKLRYQLRVWLRDDRARELREGITETAAEARRTPDVPRQAELLRRRDDALLMADELRDLRRTVEIAADNMARALGDEVEVSGPFADDRDLAQWFLARLDDDSAYLDTATRRAQRLTARRVRPPAGPERPAGRAPADGATPDTSRNVFVVHGRDEQARVQMFEFLRALDLRPLEWESLVAGTGGASPFLGNVVAGALTRAQTALVLLTPDDVVRLHPELHAPNEDPWETRFTMQARPNVLLELGMALAAYGDRTVMVIAGDHRPVADYGGRNFIRLDDSPACRQKIARRLRLAGCPVDDGGQDWLAAGRFADLTAYRRRPDPQG